MPPAKVRSRLTGRKVAATAGALGGIAGIGTLAGMLLGRATRTPSAAPYDADAAVAEAVRQSESQKVAKFLEQERQERSLMQNQARLAQANPTLYTSIMAGRRVPTGAVVLGGRPRMDLMRELAASMDSGAFQKKDPLSYLMG